MQLLRKVWSPGSSVDDMVHLWKVYCRSVLEQSCVVWHSTLSQQNIEDLERTQNTFCKLVLQQKYNTYEQALIQLNIIKLSDRRNFLTLQFGKRGIENNTLAEFLAPTKLCLGGALYLQFWLTDWLTG